eukprot:1597633-Prymnesium_polylepis.1
MCSLASDSDCDDGGPGAEYALCAYGADCLDCGGRHPLHLPTSPPPPHPPPRPPVPPVPPAAPPLPPSVPTLCLDRCLHASDGDCDDGGPGA